MIATGDFMPTMVDNQAANYGLNVAVLCDRVSVTVRVSVIVLGPGFRVTVSD